MIGNKSILGTLLVVVLLAAALLTGLFLWKRYGEKTRPATEALPAEYSLLIRFPDLENLLARLNSEGTLADQILGWKGLESSRQLAIALDSILARDLRLSGLARGSTHYLVACRRHEGMPGWLWISEFKDPPDKKDFRGFLESAFPAGISKDAGSRMASLHEIHYRHSILYYSLRNGLFLASTDAGLVEEAMERLRSKSKQAGLFPESLVRAAGKNVDANIMVNYKALREDFATLIDPGSFAKFRPEDFASCSVFDISIRPYELLINGYSTAAVDSGQWLSPLMGAIPGEAEFQRLIPGNAIRFTAYSGETFVPVPDNPASRWLSGWKDQGVAKALISVPGLTGGPQSVGIFKILPGKDPMAYQVGGMEILPDSMVDGIRTYLVKADFSRVIPGGFDSLESYFCSVLGDFFVISTGKETLSYIMESFTAGRQLSQEPRYQQAVSKLTGTGNFLFYLNLRSGRQELASWLNPAGQRFIRDNTAELESFPSLALQCSGAGELIYTNVSIPYDTNRKEVLQTEWKIRLDASLAQGPFVLEGGSVPGLLILAVDSSGSAYLINPRGQLIWKKDGIGTLTGEPFLADFGGKPCILMTIRDKLECLSLDGEMAAGFPLKLGSPAAAAATVILPAGKNTPMVLVACNDRAIYAFTEGGKTVKKWMRPMTASIPACTPVHIPTGKEDYLLVSDVKGRVMALDLDGKVRFRTRESFRKTARTGYWLNRTNSKGIILTTDQQGTLSYLSMKGTVQNTVFGKFTAEHDFYYADVDLKGGEDFIFADGTGIRAFDRFKHLLWEFSVPEATQLKADILYGENRQIYFSLASSAGQAWLVDHAGQPLAQGEFPPGTTFHFIEISEGEARIIHGSGNEVVKSILPFAD